jgi:hypothetical protein
MLWPRIALGNLAQEILFADLHPVMPQNGICGYDMEVEIGERVFKQVGHALKCDCPIARRQRNGFIL